MQYLSPVTGLQDKGSQLFNAKAFGAKGDGSTDDTTALQAALTAAGTVNGTVFLPVGTYKTTAKLNLPSNVTLEGATTTGSIISLAAGSNVSVFGNSDTTNGNSFITCRNFTVKQNGGSQTAGGGFSFTGISDCHFEKIYVDTSWTFNFFVQGVTGTTKTGTATFTNGSATVVGTSSTFTTDYAVNDIIKTAGGNFGRVQSVTDNTHLVLDRNWGHATETGVAHSKVPPNARNRILNCTFNGNSQNDNVGLGLFDDSLIQGNVSRSSTGYGFGPDHCNRTKFIGNTSLSNPVGGFGVETCGDCLIQGNEVDGCAIGIYLLSGAYRNVVVGNVVRRSSNLGISVTYNATTYPTPDDNSILNNDVSWSTNSGIRVAGAQRTLVGFNRSFNNGAAGILLSTDNALTCAETSIVGNVCYDDQTTKTQTYGIQISSGTDTMLHGNTAYPADHLTGGISDAGTNTRVNQVLDANGNTVIATTATASAVSYLNVTNAASGGTVTLAATASSGTPNFVIKGSGTFALRPTTNSANAIRMQDSTGANNILVVDSSNTRVGIGKTSPATALDVNGTVTATAGNLGTISSTAITARVVTLSSVAAHFTPNTDTTDLALISSPGANFTIDNPTGTPTNGQRWMLRITSGTTGFTPTWGTIYQSSGVATIPTTTLPASKTVTLGFVYDSTATKWVCLAADTTGY